MKGCIKGDSLPISSALVSHNVSCETQLTVVIHAQLKITQVNPEGYGGVLL